MKSIPFALLLLAWPALATDVQGVISANTSWTSSGNPYQLTGDVKVAPGATLTIGPGVQVVAAASDAANLGNQSSQVELIVEGTLTISGTAVSPVQLSTAGNPGDWRGLRVAAGGSATLTHVKVEKAYRGVEVLGAASLDQVEIVSNTEDCLNMSGPATAQVTHSRFLGCGDDSVILTAGTSPGTLNMSYSVIANGNPGSDAVRLDGHGTLHHNTIAFSGDGVMTYTSTAVNIVVRDNILWGSGAGYGLYKSSSTPGSYTATHNNVAGFSNNFLGLPATGNISFKPLFVSNTNLRLTSNSPSRQAASDGSDQGALPYLNDPTPGLVGKLFTSQTLSGNQTVGGDLIIAPGVTLTLSAGTTLNLATTDSLQGGANPNLVEIIVEGKLNTLGTSNNPVVFTSSGSAGAWQGVRFVAGSTGSTLTGAKVEKAAIGLAVFGSATAAQSHLLNSSAHGARVYTGGNLTLTGSRVEGSALDALYVEGSANQNGTLVMNTTVIANNTSDGVDGRGNLTVENNTFTNNGGYGLYLAPDNASIVQTLRNNIIADAKTTFRSGTVGTVHYNHNNNWGGAPYGVSGTNNIAVNPLFVSTTNYRLTQYSPSRKAAANGGDQGALPYVNDPSPALMGTLWENVTLSGSQSLAGDLTVAPGATLTLVSGTQISVAAGDGMQSGSDKNKSELVVKGSLVTQGTLSAPVSLTHSGSAGGWVGVTVEPAGTAQLSRTEIGKAIKALKVLGTLTADGLTLTDTTQECVLAQSGGVATMTGSTFAQCFQAIESDGTSTVNLSFSLVRNTTSSLRGALELYGPATVHHNTVVNNVSWGIELRPAAGVTQVIRDNIVYGNNGFGVYSSSNTATQYNYNNAFNNTQNNTSSGLAASGVGNLSVDPLFLGPTDFRLQASSPMRGVGSSGSDLGAFPYTIGTVQTIVVSPSNPTVAAGGTQTFTAQAFDSNGQPVAATFTWSSTAGNIGMSSGVLTASCTPGTQSNAITASANGKSGTASVTIVPGAPATLTVSPTSATLEAKGTQNFTATVKDSCNNTLSPTVSWSVGTNLGSITQAGAYTAPCATGLKTNAVTATSGALSKSVNVTVNAGPLASLSIQPQDPSLPASGVQQFNASGADSCGNSVPASVAWSALPAAGQIGTTGLFTATTTLGSYPNAVTGTANGISKSTSVTVTAGAVASVTVSPATATLAPGGKQSYTAVAKDSAGNVVNEPITWSVVNGGGTISTNGELTAGNTAGTFNGTVKATAGGASGTASVVVQPGPTARLAISPPTATLAPNGNTTFVAQVFDAFDNLTQDTVSWSVANPSAGSITQGGAFTAGTSLGTYNNAVSASVGNVSGTANVVINPGALSQLTIAPLVANVRAGGTVGFTAAGTDAMGNAIPITPTWNVLKGGGSIGPNGVFTAAGIPGTFADTVQVSVNGVAATATVVVSSGPVVQIAVTPGYPALKSGEQRQFSAKAKDSFGNEIAGVAFSWRTDPNAGTVDQEGIFTAGSFGGDFPNAVVAEAEGISGAASVRVLGAPPAPKTDGGTSDGGEETDAGTDGGNEQTPVVQPHTALEATPSCGCASTAPTAGLWLLLAMGLLRRLRGSRGRR